jgi:hypothetical protein
MAMRFQTKKLLEGFDPADLIEQSMYCFGSDDGGGGGGGDSSSMGMDDDVSAQASVSDNSSNNDSSSDMGLDSSVADQQNVSANTNAQDNFNNMDNFSYPNAQNFSVQAIDPFGIQQTGLQNLDLNIGLANMNNSGLSDQAMASIGTTGYSPDSVTGFANPTDVSDFTTADQMNSMSPSINNPISNLLTNIGLPTTQNQINMGYTPSYTNGQITGTMDYGIGMGMPSNNQNMTGSGLAVSGYAPFSSTQPSVDYGNYGDIGGNESDLVVTATTNPVSGQPICPDGYRFDDDLQACRLDTTRPNRPNNPNPFPASEAYYRATSLDKAPMNVPSGFDFNKANQNFISQFAYRPSAYQNQMGLSGFTPFRRS